MPDPQLGAAVMVMTTAQAMLLAVIAAIGLAAGVQWPASRRPALLLAWALLQDAVHRIVQATLTHVVLGDPAPALVWIGDVMGYLIPIPWALLVESVVGRGWSGSIRRTWQVLVGSAVIGVTIDVVTGRPAAPAGTYRYLVAVGALVGIVNLVPLARAATHEIRVLLVGYLVFMGSVVQDSLTGLGMLPWARGSSSGGVLLFMLSLAYAVVWRTIRDHTELQALHHELLTAQRIQSSLVPQSSPRLDGATVAFQYVPAAAVAGDIFTFIDAGPRRIGVLIADVSGHGIPAALIASMVKVAAAAQQPLADDPARVLEGIYLAIAGELPAAQFVTAVYVFIDLDRGVVRHAAAGHPPALLWHAATGQVDLVGSAGPLIMSFLAPCYPTTDIALAPGDRLLLYTDGAVEAMRADGEMFGIDRLAAMLADSSKSLERTVSDVVHSVGAFAGRGGTSLEDDCTIVALELQPVVVSAAA